MMNSEKNGKTYDRIIEKFESKGEPQPANFISEKIFRSERNFERSLRKCSHVKSFLLLDWVDRSFFLSTESPGKN